MPRAHALTCVLAVAFGSASATAQCYGIPDNVTTTGACNVIPFGDITASAAWVNQIYQTLITPAEVGNTVGLVTGLSFAPCGSGVRQHSRLTIKMGHCNLAGMTTTFANNFTLPPVTVLDVRDFQWANTPNVWNRLPLQTPFMYVPALGNLVIEVHSEGASQPTSAMGGMHSSTKPRLYAISWTGTPPATGTLGTTAGLKLELCMGTAGTATFGAGCTGSNQKAPTLDYTGSSKLGQTLSIDIANAAGVGPFAVLLGTDVAPPFPMVLDTFGMPGCRLYSNSLLWLAGVTGTTGAGSIPLPIPNAPALFGLVLFHQAGLIDIRANATGVTTTNAGNVIVGT